VKKKRQRRPAWRRIIIAAIALAALAAAWRYTALAEYINQQRIVGWARFIREAPWAPFALVLSYTPAAIVMFPRPVLTLIGVIAFGTWTGMTYAVIGIELAALATYWLGRQLKQQTVKRLAGDALEPATKVLRAHGIFAMFALNMVPVPPFVVQGLIAGAIRMKLWHYAVGSFLGALPTALAWTVFGRQVAALLEDGSNVSYWLIGWVLLVLGVLTYGVKRWFEKAAAA
jgi:phospholipase D1/2